MDHRMTPRFRPLHSVLAASGLGLCLTLSALAPAAWAADQAKSDEKIRPELGKFLQAAQQAIAAKNYAEALSQVAQTDAVKDKTPYEIYIIDRLRGAAAGGAGDLATSAKSFGAAIDSGKMPQADQVQVMGMLIGLYTNAKDYPNAVTWTQRYVKAGGNDPAILSNLVAEEYEAGDYASASRDAQAQIAAAEKAGQKPTETQIKILAASYHKANNDAAYTTAIEKMVIYYPKPDYWADLIGHVDHKPGFSDRLFLDINRLQRVTGSLTNYDAMVELDLQDGISSEAKAVADEGGSKVPKALQAKAAAAASDDRKKLDRDAKDAEGFKDGNVLVTIGYTFVGFGETQKGIDLLQKGIAKGGLKHADEAKLMLGIAYFQAGQMPKAIETFDSVTGGAGASDVAHLWSIRAKQGA
jgi:hypothetical protein